MYLRRLIYLMSYLISVENSQRIFTKIRWEYFYQFIFFINYYIFIYPLVIMNLCKIFVIFRSRRNLPKIKIFQSRENFERKSVSLGYPTPNSLREWCRNSSSLAVSCWLWLQAVMELKVGYYTFVSEFPYIHFE